MTKRKILAAALIFMLLFTLAGCGDTEPKTDPKGSDEKQSSSSAEDWFDFDENDYICSVFDEGTEEKELVIPARCKGLTKGVFTECQCEVIRFESDDDIDIAGLAIMAVPNLKTLILPKNLTVLNEWVARSNEKLETVTIPEHVASIGEDAFSYNPSLKDVTFAGNELTQIGDGAFAQDDSLERIELPEGLISLGVDVFRGCDNLKEIYLPSSLTFIDGDLLGCSTEGLTVHVKKGSWADQNRDVWDPTGAAEVVAE